MSDCNHLLKKELGAGSFAKFPQQSLELLSCLQQCLGPLHFIVVRVGGARNAKGLTSGGYFSALGDNLLERRLWLDSELKAVRLGPGLTGLFNAVVGLLTGSSVASSSSASSSSAPFFL
ncbi:hypothetical protein HDU90_005335 [Geranomyces variabilis]|nr:hypothetical protein HDU90_005335 [Geranomyces variabilis]